MKYNEGIQWLYKLNRFKEFKYDLSAVKNLSKKFGNPEKSLEFVHITGTNGKGSFAFKMANVLFKNNIKTGLFTSPHISCFRERIKINEEMISEEWITQFLQEAKYYFDQENITASFFEILTVMSLCYFKEKNVDVVCMEVGIGGRLDCSNIIQNPLLSVITSVGLDHVELLGDTIEEITNQKCGIIKKNAPVLIGPSVPFNIVKGVARKLNSEIFRIKLEDSTNDFKINGEELVKIGVSILSKRLGKQININKEVLGSQLPCRCEKMPEQYLKKFGQMAPKQIVMDVGHNIAAIESAIIFMIQNYKMNNPIILYGASLLKDSQSVLKILSTISNDIWAIKGNNPRCKSAEQLIKEGAKSNIKIKSWESGHIQETIKHLIYSDKARNKDMIICGSFFIMSESRSYLGYNDPCDELFMNEYHSV